MEEIEKILNVKKIRYEYLDELLVKKHRLNRTFQKGSVINVFIDVPNVVNQLYNPKVIESLSRTLNKSKYCIASCILNMVGHYRHYFHSRWKCFTNIYFMYNSLNDKIITDHFDLNYKKNYYEKRNDLNNEIFGAMNAVMKSNYKIISIISDYLPHVMWLDSKDIDYRAQFNYFYNNIVGENDLNIILTTDNLFYQDTLCDNTIILEPRAEKTKVITCNNIIKSLNNKSKTFDKYPEYLSINPDNITLLDIMVNQKNYNIDGIRNFGYTKAIVFLNKNEIDINEPVLNEDSIEEIFKDILTEEEITTLKKNLNIFSNPIIMDKSEKRLEMLYIKCDKFINEPYELKKVNEKYFEKFPLILDYIFEGENADF